MTKMVSVGDSMASKCADNDNDDNEDWETKLDTGQLAVLSPKNPSPAVPTQTSRPTEFQSFDDILCLPTSQKRTKLCLP